ncbi:MAG: hypothetical protein KF819_33295 [Labilithrix sp.]|nr:hypothetical protein [Labilithrix sp.]
MGLLVPLTLLVLFASVAIASNFKSRAETVIAASLVFNGLILLPIYGLGLVGALTRVTLGLFVVVMCGLVVFVHARRNDGLRTLRDTAKRSLKLMLLPLEGIWRTWQRRSLTMIGAVAATLAFPYMLLCAYLAPAWRDWDALWYHEPLVGFTIQNHGFAPVPLPPMLQVINGVQRLCEMTQVWFAIWAGRQVVDVANIVFMPLFAASMFALARRYTKDVLTGIAWASAIVLVPGYLRLVQSTMVDPQSAALLLAAAYWVTHPVLDRKNALYAILALTLAVGAKIWSIVPVGLLSFFLLVRLVRRFRENGGLATLGLVALGTSSLVGMQGVTYLRNWIYFKNPLWPMIAYENAKLGIHWKGAIAVDPNAARVGINFNEPFFVFYEKMLGRPYTATGTHHTWQIDDWGFALSWVVLPLAALSIAVLILRWLASSLSVMLGPKRYGPDEATAGSALMLAIVGGMSLFLSPALHIARYHMASLGMLVACICWLSSRTRGARLAIGAALIAQVGSILMIYWAPRKAPWMCVYPPVHVVQWMKTPYPKREISDIGTVETPRMLISPVMLEAGMAREREVKSGDVVAFDSIDFLALLWNNDYSNEVVWLSSSDPLAEASRAGARWVYTRSGTTLAQQLGKAESGWEIVGTLEAEGYGSVWRKKRQLGR